MVPNAAANSEPVSGHAKPKFLELHSAIMRPADAMDLRWYFASGGFGMFCPSPTAALMATLEMYARVAVPCERCGGDVAAAKPGCGFVVTKKSKTRAPTQYEAEMLKLLDLNPDAELPVQPDRICHECQGRGWLIGKKKPPSGGAVTARPTQTSRGNSAGVSVQDANIARLGLVSRRLKAVESIAHIARAALEAYYAPDGGDPGALWHLVPAGRTMLRSNPNKLPPLQLFANIRAEQAEKPSPNRAAQIQKASEQAAELYRAACQAWNSVVEPRVFQPNDHEAAEVFPAWEDVGEDEK